MTEVLHVLSGYLLNLAFRQLSVLITYSRPRCSIEYPNLVVLCSSPSNWTKHSVLEEAKVGLRIPVVIVIWYDLELKNS